MSSEVITVLVIMLNIILASLNVRWKNYGLATMSALASILLMTMN